jgi:hypothetical protein
MRFVVGGVVGAYIGFLLRPSIPLVGQLPAMVVLTSGQYLRGFDKVFVPTAQTSFGYLITGLVVGMLIAVMFKPRAVVPATLGNAFFQADSNTQHEAPRHTAPTPPAGYQQPLYSAQTQYNAYSLPVNSQQVAQPHFQQPPFCPHCRAYFIQNALFCAMCGYNRRSLG